MKELKSALGKDVLNQTAFSKPSESIRGARSSSTSSMWSIAQGLDANESEEVQAGQTGRIANQILQIIKNWNQNGQKEDDSLKELMACCSRHLGKGASQSRKLKQLQKSMNQAILKAPSELQNPINRVFQLIKIKKRKQRSKEVKSPMNFDEIAQKIFKKPSENGKNKEKRRKILQVNLDTQVKPRNRKKSNRKQDSNNTKNSGQASQDSGECRLGKLLSSDKYEKKKSSQECPTEQGYSFSAVMSATTVKQRTHPMNISNQNDLVNFTNNQKKIVEEDSQKNIGDEAFIFYRPNKHRK